MTASDDSITIVIICIKLPNKGSSTYMFLRPISVNERVARWRRKSASRLFQNVTEVSFPENFVLWMGRGIFGININSVENGCVEGAKTVFLVLLEGESLRPPFKHPQNRSYYLPSCSTACEHVSSYSSWTLSGKHWRCSGQLTLWESIVDVKFFKILGALVANVQNDAVQMNEHTVTKTVRLLLEYKSFAFRSSCIVEFYDLEKKKLTWNKPKTEHGGTASVHCSYREFFFTCHKTFFSEISRRTIMAIFLWCHQTARERRIRQRVRSCVQVWWSECIYV